MFGVSGKGDNRVRESEPDISPNSRGHKLELNKNVWNRCKRCGFIFYLSVRGWRYFGENDNWAHSKEWGGVDCEEMMIREIIE